jgi:exodeoxyribonuclease VII small subunit
MTNQTLDFEAALLELEKVVSSLDGEIKLEHALQLFEKGMQLSADCETFLKAAEQKVEILRKTAAGEVITEVFETTSIVGLEVLLTDE